MTALVALKYGTMDQILTATNTVNITEPGAALCGIKPGDTMTLHQALHILMIKSANDVAMLIAENVSGSVEGFVQLMNEEAKAIGATNTLFQNPHGLTQENHYTTVYDLYLIFNEAMKYDLFQEIIHMSEYQTTYYDKAGEEKKLNVSSTNRFFKGDFKAPDKVTVIGGKTGTTNAAGHCLILMTRDVNGQPYISVVLRSTSSDELYTEMIDLLDEIHK
jgi:D-alanyl-D-alanine carboxypeptidase